MQTINGPRVVNTGQMIVCDENRRPIHPTFRTISMQNCVA
jgi:hypothetical protein